MEEKIDASIHGKKPIKSGQHAIPVQQSPLQQNRLPYTYSHWKGDKFSQPQNQHIYPTYPFGIIPAEGNVIQRKLFVKSSKEIFRYIAEENQEQKLNSEPEDSQDTLIKINVVNTGAGDAIVMTLPAGYLILDLGTDFNILSNYLSLRRNKRHSIKAGVDENDRGIPLKGDKSLNEFTNSEQQNGNKDSLVIGRVSEEDAILLLSGLFSVALSTVLFGVPFW